MPFEWPKVEKEVPKERPNNPKPSPQKFTPNEQRLLQLMSQIEKEEGIVDRDVLPEKFPLLPTEDIFKLIVDLQKRGELVEPFPHFYRTVHEPPANFDPDSVLWTTKMPVTKSSQAKGLYEVTPIIPTFSGIIKAITESGSYHLRYNGYTYWVMKDQLARRKVKENADT